ncbi:MAG TPA: potassium channel family protein [Dehalococcoidia bacterium]|nr:potassium channel family protein [Dehalococcoidia bacterium]
MAGELTTHKITRRQRRADMLHRFEEATEWPLLLLALILIPLLTIQFAFNPSDSADTAIETALWIIWAIFAVELGIRTYLVERKIPYLVRHWYDVLIVIVPFLRPLRIARSARAARLLRLSRAAPFIVKAFASTHDLIRHRGLEWVIAAGIIIVFAGSAVVLAFEQSSEGPINDYGTALWWAMTTVTTVGYGDATPVTPEGRGVAILLMLVGIAFFSWITANIAAFLVEFGGGETHGVTTHDLMAKLEEMETEIKALRAEQNGEAPIVEASD